MSSVVLDTHAVVWALLDRRRLSPPALAALEAGVDRVPRDAVPEMPDRIIAATAMHLGLPLVSRDRKIRAADLTSIW